MFWAVLEIKVKAHGVLRFTHQDHVQPSQRVPSKAFLGDSPNLLCLSLGRFDQTALLGRQKKLEGIDPAYAGSDGQHGNRIRRAVVRVVAHDENRAALVNLGTDRRTSVGVDRSHHV